MLNCCCFFFSLVYNFSCNDKYVSFKNKIPDHKEYKHNYFTTLSECLMNYFEKSNLVFYAT